MRGIADRYEGEFIVIKIDGITQDISKNLVGKDVQVDDVFELQDKMA